VTISATDSDGHLSTLPVNVTVTAANDGPTISAIGSTTILEDSNSGEIGFTISDKETADLSTLTVAATSSDQTLIPNGGTNIVTGGTLGSRTIKITPAPNRFGRAIITLVVSDTGGGATASNFEVTVTPVNDNPTALGVLKPQLMVSKLLIRTPNSW
jgi:hypothetical protein